MDNTWIIKDLLAKFIRILFLTVVIGADKLPSEIDLKKIKNSDFSLFTVSPSTSEELQIPKYLSFDELTDLEDIFGDFSDLELQSYLPPSSVHSDFAPPSPSIAYSAPLFQSGHSIPSAQAGYSPPTVQSGHTAIPPQSSYTAVSAVKTDSLAFLESPKEGKQLSSFGSSSDGYSSHEFSKSPLSSNSLLSNHGHLGGSGGYDKNSLHQESKGMPYEFGYVVKDEYTKNYYGHQESSDGDVVKGEYRVLLPDGRTQIVSYTADHIKGYQADVRYEGEAKYPERSPKQNFETQKGSFGSSKQLQQSYNSLDQEGKQAPFKHLQLTHPLPLENHNRDLPEPTFSVLEPQQSYSLPQPQQSHSFLQPQQSFDLPQPQLSYSLPLQSVQTFAPPIHQQKKYTPPKPQLNHNSLPVKQDAVLSKPQQSYSKPKPQLSFAPPQKSKLHPAFDPPKPQESYTQPILQQRYSVPEPRQSYTPIYSQQNHAPPLHQQSFTIPQPTQSYSSSELQQSYVPPDQLQESFSIPEIQQSNSLSEIKQGNVTPQPQQNFEVPQPHQSFETPQPSQSFETPKLQSYEIQKHQQGFEIPQPQQTTSWLESRESYSDHSNINTINLDTASITLYLPPTKSQSVKDSVPQLDTRYLTPFASIPRGPHRKRSATSALYRKSPPSMVIKPFQKIPLHFDSLKNKKTSKKVKENFKR